MALEHDESGIDRGIVNEELPDLGMTTKDVVGLRIATVKLDKRLERVDLVDDDERCRRSPVKIREPLGRQWAGEQRKYK